MTKLLRTVALWIAAILSTGLGIVSFHYLGNVVTNSYPILGQEKDFILPDLNGKNHHSQEWHGKVVLINFWATWCPPCRKEIPDLINLYHNYRDQGLLIVGIAIDQPDKVRQFVAKFAIDYLNLVEENTGMEWAVRYGDYRGGLPYTVLIDRSGKVISTHLGELSISNTEAQIRKLL